MGGGVAWKTLRCYVILDLVPCLVSNLFCISDCNFNNIVIYYQLSK